MDKYKKENYILIEYDDAYKADFFNRIAISADDRLFELADMVSRVIEEETTNLH